MPRKMDSESSRANLSDRLHELALDGLDNHEAELFAIADSNFNEAVESFRHGRLQAALVMSRATIDAALFASRYPKGSPGERGEEKWVELKDQARMLGFDDREINDIRRVRMLGSLAVHSGSRYNEAMKELAGLPAKERQKLLAKNEMFTNAKMVGEQLEKTAKLLVEIRGRTVDGVGNGKKALVPGGMDENEENGIGLGTGILAGRWSATGASGPKCAEHIERLMERSRTLKIMSPEIDDYYSERLVKLAKEGRQISVLTTSWSEPVLKKTQKKGKSAGGGIAAIIIGAVTAFAGFWYVGVPLMVFGFWIMPSSSSTKIAVPENLGVETRQRLPRQVKLVLGDDEAIAFSGNLTYEATHSAGEQIEIMKDPRNLVRLAGKFNSIWSSDDTLSFERRGHRL